MTCEDAPCCGCCNEPTVLTDPDDIADFEEMMGMNDPYYDDERAVDDPHYRDYVTDAHDAMLDIEFEDRICGDG